MESKSQQVHAKDVTHFSSPIHSMNSPPKRTPKLTSTTTTDLPLHTNSSFPKRSSSSRGRKDASQAPLSTPLTPSSQPQAKGWAAPRSRISIIASSLRKLRRRDNSTDGEQPHVPVLPEFPFSISATDYAAAEARILSMEKTLLHPHVPLRNAHSDSNIHHHRTQSYSPRELHDAEKQFHSSLRQGGLPSRPPPHSVPQDVETDLDDEGEVMIDAGVVVAPPKPVLVLDISSSATVQPIESAQTEAQRYKEMILKRRERRPLTVDLSLGSHEMVSETQVTSATGTAFSSGSGTEAGSEDGGSQFNHSPEFAQCLRRSISLTIPRPNVDGVDYGEVDGILKVLFPSQDDAFSPAWNRVSFGIPLPEGASPNLNPTIRSQPVPPLSASRRPSQLRSHSMQPLSPSTWLEEQQRVSPLHGKIENRVPGQGLVSLQTRASDEFGDVLQNYAQLARLIGE